MKKKLVRLKDKYDPNNDNVPKEVKKLKINLEDAAFETGDNEDEAPQAEIDTDVVISDRQKQYINKDPKEREFDSIDDLKTKIEVEFAMAKLRWRNKEIDTNNEELNKRIEGGETSLTLEDVEREKADSDNIYDAENKVFDYTKVRVTNLKGCKRVKLPDKLEDSK